MISVLFVGDVHATPEELEDCERLFNLVEATARAEKADYVVLLGDSYHTHNIIRAEVMAFYRKRFKAWRDEQWETIGIVGNHDYAGEGRPEHAMLIHDEQITVVDRPVSRDSLLFLPYYSDRERFVFDAGNSPGTNVLVCHQTFDGSRYENGYPALDGVDVSRIPQKTIISGHIHTPQSFGKVTYIGAPRWRTLTDANVDRAIWLYTFSLEGNVLGKAPVDTSRTCRPIRYVVETPDELFESEVNPRNDPDFDWRFDVHGPADFIEARKGLWSKFGAKVRTFCTDRAAARVRESEGVGAAFHTFLGKYTAKHGTDKTVLAKMARERLDV